ncbi:MAG TPA: serine/threonine-protein kinase, partial [Gemmataceae bacterium]|nr:serine/threonine-protein kinase [Gemmataceae bacterium]
MPEQPVRDEDQLDRQLAELDENPSASVDTAVRQLHAELETLASALKSPPPADPHQEESACRRAVAQARSLMAEAAVALPAAAAPLPLPERLEHFRILKLLGQGGMGAVYLAEDTRLGRQVALKTLKPELAANPQARERFLREARLAATIEHDHIVPIYHVGEANGVPFLAMPFLKGSSLEEMIRSARKWTPVQMVRLGVQIAEGLAAAHARGLIHRDIKPGNLWVEPTGGGRVKLLDFGLARASEGDIGLTQSGTILGTPAYMAPEQARGEKVDARADLYSLGVVLYRLATGQLPLQGNDTMSMLMALASSQPRPVRELAPDLPPALAELIMRLLTKDRAQRPASAREVSQTLRRIQESLKPPAPAAAPVLDSATLVVTEPDTPRALPQPQPTPRKPRRRLPLAVAAGLLLLIGGGLLLQQVILRITDREGKTREIELKPGDRIEIVEKPAPADAPPKKPPEVKIIAGDPDRRAAEYVLSIGGVVRVNGEGREFKTVAELPKGKFRLTFVHLGLNQKVTDAGLAHFKDCKGLTHLYLDNCGQVTDAGLAHFKDCKGLTHLYLEYCGQVTDAGLAHFKDCKGLTHLYL